MNLWNKIVLGCKFFFGGFESATDYAIALLNEYLISDGVKDRVHEIREYVVNILGYLVKYEKYCPAIWVPHYEKLKAAIQTLVDAFEDGQLTTEEVEKAIADVKAAIEEWMK